NVIQVADIQVDPTNSGSMQAFNPPSFSPAAMPPLPPPACFVQLPTGYMPAPPGYLPVATRLSIPGQNLSAPFAGFPTCDALSACSCGCNCGSDNCACHAGAPPCPCDSSTATDEANRLEHILEAVHHLEAAGLQPEADQLRRRCDDDVKVVIHNLKAAESELAELRRESFNNSTSLADPNGGPGAADVAATCADKKIKVRVQLLELNRTKMRDLGFDFTAIHGKTSGSSSAGDLLASLGHCSSQTEMPGDSALSAFISALKKEGIVKVLGVPTIMTRDGQLAEIFIGEELPFVRTSKDGSTTINYRKVGSQLKVVPTIAADGKVRLHMNFHFSALKDSDGIQQVCDSANQIDEHELQAVLEIESGDTGAISGLDSNRVVTKTVEEVNDNRLVKSDVKEAIETELVVLVQPEIIDAGEVAPSVGAIPATLSSPEPSNLTWRPVRQTLAAESIVEAVGFDQPVDSSSSACCHEHLSSCCDEKAECCGDSTIKLNSFGIELPKACESFFSGSEIHFEKSPTSQPYEIDPATFKFIQGQPVSACQAFSF
ncbi:MAG TPA: hypothetical protein VGI75_03780, partial [Pirellulales bacterium]